MHVYPAVLGALVAFTSAVSAKDNIIFFLDDKCRKTIGPSHGYELTNHDCFENNAEFFELNGDMIGWVGPSCLRHNPDYCAQRGRVPDDHALTIFRVPGGYIPCEKVAGESKANVNVGSWVVTEGKC